MITDLSTTKLSLNPVADPDYLTLKSEVEALCRNIDGMVVDSPEAVSRITADVNLGQKVANSVEKLRKLYKDPIVQVGKEIDSAFKVLSDPIEKSRTGASSKIQQYNAEQRRLADEKARAEQARAEAQRRIDEENAKRIREAEEAGIRTVDEDGVIEEEFPVELVAPIPEVKIATPPPPIVKTITDTGSSQEKMIPKFKVADITKVPTNLLLVNEKAITAMLKAGVRQISGLEIWEEPEIKFWSK